LAEQQTDKIKKETKQNKATIWLACCNAANLVAHWLAGLLS
jgi:hypothetical protein